MSHDILTFLAQSDFKTVFQRLDIPYLNQIKLIVVYLTIISNNHVIRFLTNISS